MVRERENFREMNSKGMEDSGEKMVKRESLVFDKKRWVSKEFYKYSIRRTG